MYKFPFHPWLQQLSGFPGIWLFYTLVRSLLPLSYVSCSTISNAAFANTIPVSPPTVNKNINPIANSIGVVYLTVVNPPLPYKVANHEKTLIPVGTPINNVLAEKYALV